MRVDVQNHIFLPSYLKFFKEHPGKVRVWENNKNFMMDFSGSQILGIEENQMNEDALLEAMELNKIDISFISYPLPDPYMFDAGYDVSACILANDCIASLVEKYPKHFRGLAFLPWMNVKEAKKELLRVKSMGFRGVILFPDCGAKNVDDRELLPLYEMCAGELLPIVLHPTIPKWADAIGAYSMPATIGFVIDTGFALYRLIKGGILKEVPDLKIVVPHAGGILPYLDGRINYIPPSQRPDGKVWSHIPDVLKYGNIWYDTANPSAKVLQYLLQYVSADKVMFATDYPYVEHEVIIRIMSELDLDDQTMEKINWKNANHVFQLGLE